MTLVANRFLSWTAALTLGLLGGCATGSSDPFGVTFGQADPTADGGPSDDTAGDATSSSGGVASTDDDDGIDPEGDGSGMSGADDDPSGGSSETGSPVDCNPPCQAGESCVAGTCFPDAGDTTTGGPARCHDVDGEYATCLGAGDAVDTSGCGNEDPICITGGDPVIAGVCAVQDCADACDCPAAPATGTATPACSDITGDSNLCFLDCAAGQTCPTGMICFGETACIWPGEGADGVDYGDCFNNGLSICGLEGTCLSDNTDAPTVSVCTAPCDALGDCPAAPPGGTAPVTCQDVTDEGDNECVIDCSLGTCPTGMTCFSDLLCMWN